MSLFKCTRRWLLATGFTFASTLVMGISVGSAEDALLPIPEEPETIAIALDQPKETPLRDKPVVRRGLKGWREVDQSVSVEFTAPKHVNGRWETTVKLTNGTDDSLAGPVRVVVDDLNLKGATVRTRSGQSLDGVSFVEILPKGKSLKIEESTPGRRIELATTDEFKTEQIDDFSPQYRVLVAARRGTEKSRDGESQKFTQEQLEWTMTKQMLLDETLRKMENKDIFGTGTSVDDDGRLQITVYSRIENPTNVPAMYDGVPVRVELTSPIYSDGGVQPGANTNSPSSDASSERIKAQMALRPIPGITGPIINPTARFSRPVPIGVEIGNESACSYFGTLGCRTARGSSKYVMSNYHVLVPSKISAVRITQPHGCSNTSNDSLGRLTSYYRITFSKSASNRYDAAWASTTTSLTGTRPADGYGKLGTTVSHSLNMKVQKYGRTTKFTSGTITAVNVTINVSYPAGTARFVGTFQVKPDGRYSQFSAGGDSGSLVVKQGTNQPVGLLFAGSGTATYCCPVAGGMLTGAKMTIDTD